MKIQGVLFDLDGTLLDSLQDFIFIINTMLSAKGFDNIVSEQIRDSVSEGASAMINQAFPWCSDTKKVKYKKEFLNLYIAKISQSPMDYHLPLFEGVTTMLSAIESSGKVWGIVTNKPRQMSQHLIQHFPSYLSCATLICSDDVSREKPAPDSLLKACDKINLAPNRCVYVGDHKRDIVAGKSAGMLTIAALWGYLKPTEQPKQWQPDFLAPTIGHVQNWLNVR